MIRSWPPFLCFPITLAMPKVALAHSPDAAAAGYLVTLVVAAAVAIGATLRGIAIKREEGRPVHVIGQALKALGGFVLILVLLWFTLLPLLYLLLG